MSDSNSHLSKKSGDSRRSFLAKSTSAVVAGGFAGSLYVPSVARSAHVAGSDTIKIGLIGCGGRGTGATTQALNTSGGPLKLVAMGDAFQNRLDRALDGISEKHADKIDLADRKFVGFDAYKKVLASDIDLVILATPPGFRPLHFEAAIKAGKHVFMEKPVAVDAPGVRRVIEANKMAKENGLAVAVGLQRRHERLYREVMDELKGGQIGHINFMRCYWNGGGVWVRPREDGQTELEYQMRNWYYFNWLCGDHITEQHIHNLDVINWLKDDYPVKAQGQGGREVRKGIDHGQIFDHHSVEFTYRDGSVMLSQCRHIPECWSSVSEHAHGSKGTANIGAGVLWDMDGKEVFKSTAGRGGHQQEHHDLFADIRNGVIPNEGDYGARSTMTSIFGRMCTYSGKEITWDQAINSELSLADYDGLDTMKTSEPPLKPNDEGRYSVPVPGSSWDDVL